MTSILPTELEEIRKVSNLVQVLTLEYGSKSLEIEEAKRQLRELEANKEQIYLTYQSAVDSNNELIEKLRSKYGDCRIDLETGQIS